jgi:branched-chain amino acid transport system ATP-binding protein
MTPLLECRELDAGYNGVAVVREFSMTLEAGEVVALLGPNGAGKTTVLLTLAGLLPPLNGTVELLGQPIPVGRPHLVTRRGLALVPDDRSLFTTLTTRENLEVGPRRDPEAMEQVLDYFPALRTRLNLKAGMLSGGEAQMLAVARALIQRPKVLLIDEMSMGLAPVIIEELLPRMRAIALQSGAGVILVEQHVGLAVEVADRVIVLIHGSTAFTRPAAEVAADPGTLEAAYLGG